MSVKRINLGIKDVERKNLKDKLMMGGKMFGRSNPVIITTRDVKTKKVIETQNSNLITYPGRNFLLQKAFNQNMTTRQWKDNYISWLGVGIGGAVGGQPLTPSSPELPNYQLGSHGTVNAGTRYVTVDGKDYHAIDDGYPHFTNDPDIDNGDLYSGCTQLDPEDGNTYRCDKFLIGIVKVTIAAHECNGGTDPSDYQDISECGIFQAPSSSLGYSFIPGDMNMFARVCFSTIRKTDQREIVISWYFFF